MYVYIYIYTIVLVIVYPCNIKYDFVLFTSCGKFIKKGDALEPIMDIVRLYATSASIMTGKDFFRPDTIVT